MKLFVLNFSSDIPIFQQIVDGIEILILSHAIKVGDFLPSVRDMAVEHTVNPNTVAKSYKILQDMNLVENVRGMGLRVLSVKEGAAIRRMKVLLSNKASDLVSLAKSLKVSKEELIELTKSVAKEKNL
jgi:GntR family transcriptional regulator